MRRIILKVPGVAGEGRLTLPEREGHHVRTVLRLGAGHEVLISDGHGQLWRATLACVSSHAVEVTVHGIGEASPPPKPVTLAVCLVKKGFDDLVRQSVEMGVERLCPLAAERMVKGLRAKHGRWMRIAQEAEKQSTRSSALVIEPLRGVKDHIAENERTDRFVADPAAGESLLNAALRLQAPYEILIGPEGGWSPAELALFQGCRLKQVSLGDHVLRTGTAALVSGAVLCGVCRLKEETNGG